MSEYKVSEHEKLGLPWERENLLWKDGVGGFFAADDFAFALRAANVHHELLKIVSEIKHNFTTHIMHGHVPDEEEIEFLERLKRVIAKAEPEPE